VSGESSSVPENTVEANSGQRQARLVRRREAFAGLIAPIGVDLDLVVSALAQALNAVKYQTNPIQLTDIFRENQEWYDVKYLDELTKYKKYISAGDKLCQESGRKDMLALYGIASLERHTSRGDMNGLPSDVLHIFRQIKRVEESSALDQVYGRNILFLACYAPRKSRIKFLVDKMLRTERGANKSVLEAKALEIIGVDEDERDNPYGPKCSGLLSKS
jgi:cytidine deaminase